MISFSSKALPVVFMASLASQLAYSATTSLPEAPAADGGKLPEITATRGEASPMEVPNTVRSVSAQTIADRQPRSLPEALRELPSVSIQKTSNGQGSPFVRGFTGFRNLALIDGVRLNNSTFREGPNQYWNTIDLNSTDRIELVPGQGSVLYGSDAIGGTLNVLTKGSDFRTRKAGQFISGLSGYRFSTAEDSHLGRGEITLGDGGKWGLHVGGSWQTFGDVEAAELGRQPKTGYDQWAYHVRLDAALADNWTLTAVHQQVQQDDVWRTHSTVFGLPWRGTVIGSDLKRAFDQERTLSYLKVEGKELNQFVDAAALTLSYQTAEETQERLKSSRDAEFSLVDLNTWGLDLQLTSETPLGTLTYGVDYYRDSVDSSASSYKADGTLDKRGIQGPVGDDSTSDLLGIYLQDKIDHGPWHFYLGARYTHAAVDVGRFENPVTKAADSYSDSWDNASGSARFALDLDAKKQFALYGGVSQGFRSPNLSDLSRLDIARSGELEIAATDLNPEEYVNFELGLKAETETFSGSITYFHTQIDNMIVRRPTGAKIEENTVVSKANGGDGYVQGLELAANIQLSDHWSLFGSGAWMEGEVDQFPNSDGKSAREPLSRVVPYHGTAGIRWQNTEKTVWTELACTAAAKADRLNSADRADTQRIPVGGTPGWTLLSLRAGWKVNDSLTLTGSLDNLLDEAYRAHGSGSNEPGFGGTVGVTVNF